MSADEIPVTVIESMCVSCHNDGETRMLLTRIPYFRDVVVASFECPHCGYKNNDLQLASEIQEMGERTVLTVTDPEDLDRQVVKSEHASVLLPCLDFEIPPQTQKGLASTVEGIISQAADNLEKDQPVRFAMDKEVAGKIQEVIEKLRRLTDRVSFPFEFVLDDPSGNSFIENPQAPAKDPRLTHHKYQRSKEQQHAMGYYETQEEKPGADLPADLKAPAPAWDLAQPLGDDTGAEGITFKMPCPNCGQQGSQNMCEIDIPGFRKCMIMAFNCDNCGTKSNEVKPGGAIGEKARRWILNVESSDDLSRDVLKSDMAGVSIPALELTLEEGSLGGVFTTVEGLLRKIADELENKFPFVGDSQLEERKAKVLNLTNRLIEYADGKNLPFELILDDAADHSHIGRRGAEILFLTGKKEASKEEEMAAAAKLASQPDPNLKSVRYDRSFEQNEMLGLNDMKVDNYD